MMHRQIYRRARVTVRRQLAVFWVFAATLSTARIGWAESLAAAPYRLNWTREASAGTCISPERLIGVVSLLVGREPAREGEHAIVIEGRATSGDPPARFRVELRVLAPDGEMLGTRVLSTEKERCSALNSSLLLVLALAINPDSVTYGLPAPVAQELMQKDDEENVANTATVEPKDDVPPPNPRATLVASKAIRIERRRFEAHAKRRWSLLTEVGLSMGELPKPSAGLNVGIRRTLSDVYAMSLTGAVWLPREARGNDTWTSAVGVSVGATHMRGLLCARGGTDAALQLGTCGGGQFGLRWFSAHGFATQYRSTRLLFGPVLGVYSSARLTTSIILRVSVNLAMQLPRDRFSYADPLGAPVVLSEPTLLACDTSVGLGFPF